VHHDEKLAENELRMWWHKIWNESRISRRVICDAYEMTMIKNVRNFWNFKKKMCENGVHLHENVWRCRGFLMKNEWNIREIMKMSGDHDLFQENEWKLRGFQ